MRNVELTIPLLVLDAILGGAGILAFSASSSNLNPSLAETGTTKNVATQILQGVGPSVSQDHLQQFNLKSIDEILSEWTANRVQKATESQSKLQLSCRSLDRLYVDSFDIAFPRVSDSMGIELQEIAGGREDGVGVTVVVGSSAPHMHQLLPGDSIASVSLARRSVSQLQDKEEILTVLTECLDYDASVKAIQSLPKQTTGLSEEWRLTIKRIRRKPMVNVELVYPPSSPESNSTVSLKLLAGENLRQGLLTRGYSPNDPNAPRFDGKGIGSGNCGAGGLCRTCSVRIAQGSNLLNAPRVAEQQQMGEGRLRLACKTIVGYGMQEGTVQVHMYPNQW